MSVYPTNLTSDRLQITGRIHGIPPVTMVLGAYATSKTNILKPLPPIQLGNKRVE